MATISGYNSYSMGVLFSGLNTTSSKNSLFSNSMSGSDILGINYSDWATIRSGSYFKLLNAYYGKGGQVSDSDDTTSSSTSTSKDSTRTLAVIESDAKSVEKSVAALQETGDKSLFNEVTKTDENGNKTSDLKYNVENNKSTIILGDNLKYGYSGAKNPVNGVYSQYLIKSNTNNAYGGNLDRIKTAEQIRQEAITELTNINLGLKEREQPDIAINKDLYSAKVQVGDYNHIYNYADRFTNIATDENATDPTVKFGNKYGNSSK